MADGDFNWLDYARAINEWNQARQNKKNQGFKQAPMSPEQRAVWQYAFDKTKALPDANNDLYPTARYYGTTGTSIDIDALKAGKTGYKPVPPPTPAQLSAIIGGQGAAPAKSGNEEVPANIGGNGNNVRGGEPMNNIGGTSPYGEGIPTPRMPNYGGATYDQEAGVFRKHPGDVGASGQITSMNPTGATGSQFQTGAQQGMPSNGQGASMDRANGEAFRQFLSTYGRAAAMAVFAIMTSNPGMAFGAAVQAWRAHQAQGQTPPAGPGGTIPGSIAGSQSGRAWGN